MVKKRVQIIKDIQIWNIRSVSQRPSSCVRLIHNRLVDRYIVSGNFDVASKRAERLISASATIHALHLDNYAAPGAWAG